MTQKHSPTPTPWRVSALDYWTIVADGKRVAECVVQDESTIGRRRDEESEANASLIVRAVNAHDALVSALEAIVNAHDAMVDDFEEQVVEIARAALRASRGEA